MLTPEQKKYFEHQIILPSMSEAACQKLLRAKVLILGLNTCGQTTAQHLIQVGIGEVGLVADAKERVTIDNLEKKLKTLEHTSDDTQIKCHTKAFTAHSAEEILRGYNVVIDGLSNWQTKLLASDTCMHMKISFIHAAVLNYRLQVFAMVPGKSACLRCAFHRLGMDDLSRGQTESGIYGPAWGMASALQASEAIHLIAGLGIVGASEFIQFDCLRREFDPILGLNPSPDCPDCGRIL